MANNVKETYANCDIRINGDTLNEIRFNGERARIVECNGKKLNDVHVEGTIRIKIYVNVNSTIRTESGTRYKGYATITFINTNNDDYNEEYTFETSFVNIIVSFEGVVTKVINSTTNSNLVTQGIKYTPTTILSGSSVILRIKSKYGDTYELTYTIPNDITLSKKTDKEVWTLITSDEIQIDETFTYKE